VSQQPHLQSAQRGAALIVSLIMLVVITMLVVGAFTSSSVNVKVISNMQSRDEAIAAGNEAIERVISSDFTAVPQPQGFDIDVNNDGINDYQVNFATPRCLGGAQIPAANPPPSSLALGVAFNVVAANFYRTTWELVGTVTDLANRGANARVHQGVAVLVNQLTFNTFCSATAP